MHSATLAQVVGEFAVARHELRHMADDGAVALRAAAPSGVYA